MITITQNSVNFTIFFELSNVQNFTKEIEARQRFSTAVFTNI